MKKGIAILILITLSLILIKPPKIKATEFEDNWADGIPQLMAIDYLDCTTKGTSSRGNTICTKTVATKSSTFITGTGTRNYAINTNPLTIGSNGYSISTTNPIVAKNGYVYNVNLYGCGNKSIHTTTHDLFFGENGQDVNKNIKISETLINIWSPPGIQSGNIIDTMTPCFRISSLVVPERDDYGYLTLRLKSSTAISDLDIALISLEVRELGLYTNEIQNIIQNSGFATAESVEEVQEAVDRVEEAITGEYEYNDTPSEELEGKEELDNLKDKEEELLGNLDFSGADNLEITIEPETASFIWEIVERLRGMSGKIILLITSILGLGIIKMILNR